jgi:tetratricopeptide (TPR) repeat protein
VPGFGRGTPARICGASAIAFDLWEADRADESFPLMVEAYRDSAGMGLERAEAASNLAEAIRVSGDYRESVALHREALAYYQANRLYDLAAEEWSLIGWSLLEEAKADEAIQAFTQSMAVARRVPNRLAELYAQSGLCEAHVERHEARKAASYCRATFEAMKGSGQLIEYNMAAIEGGRLADDGQPRAALAILTSLLSGHAEMLGDHYRIIAYQARARAYRGLGMETAAFVDMEKAAELLRDQHQRSQRRSNAVARARFQFEELEGRLRLQQQQNKAQARLFAIAGSLGALVALLLALLVGRELRSRRHFEAVQDQGEAPRSAALLLRGRYPIR